MSGNEAVYQFTTIIAALVLVIVMLILVPTYKSVGAAVAIAASQFFFNAASVWLLWRKTRLLALPYPLGRYRASAESA